MNAVTRAFDAKIDDVSQVDRSLVARINTAGVDRYKTVIDPRGARLENYRKNPVTLWEHGKDPRRFTDPIGRNLWIKHGGGERPTELLAKTRFLEDDFSQQRWEWYRDGVLSAFSVNILPADAGPPTKDEIRARPDWEPAATVYRTWELAEYSGTSVPGNADTLVADRAGKLLDLVSRNLIALPDDVMPIVEEKARSICLPDEVLKASIGQHIEAKMFPGTPEEFAWGEMSRSDPEADPLLAAIEAFKHKDKGRTFAQVQAELVGLIRAWHAEVHGDLEAMIDLAVRGRV